MLRRHRRRRHAPNGNSAYVNPIAVRPDSSRISPLVVDNPVNQAADWSQDSYLIEDLVNKFPLPQIVRCSDKLLPGEESHLPVNVHVPMLLFSGRTAQKLLAKHVAPGPETRHGQARLTETDESIVIPIDYDGHFLRLQGRTTNDTSVVKSLQYIAQNPVPAFVNFTQIVSFHSEGINNHNIMHNSSGGTGSYSGDNQSQTDSGASKMSKKMASQQRLLPQKKTLHPPGSVFVVTGTTKGFANHKRKVREVTLLRCQDQTGKQMLIPIDQPGEFVEAESPQNGSMKLSVLPPDLIAANRYPGLVRYVYGNNAPRLTPCSLMFTLVDTFTEDTLIGCLLYPKHAMMIELPLMSSLSFQVALNRDALMTLPLPRHALAVVQSRRETFVRDLKLKVKLLHRVNSAATHGQSFEGDEDLPSATVRARQFVNEAYFYL